MFQEVSYHSFTKLPRFFMTLENEFAYPISKNLNKQEELLTEYKLNKRKTMGKYKE